MYFIILINTTSGDAFLYKVIIHQLLLTSSRNAHKDQYMTLPWGSAKWNMTYVHFKVVAKWNMTYVHFKVVAKWNMTYVHFKVVANVTFCINL